MKLLWVTAFRDLKRHQWNASSRTLDFYLECFERIAGPLSPHLVCFADEPFAEQVRKFGVKTLPYLYEDTLTPKHLERQTEILRDQTFKDMIPEFLRLCPEFNIPEYGLVNCSKTSFLRRASDLFPEYTHYAWIDFGYAKTPAEAPPESPFVVDSLVDPDKILIASFRNAILDNDGEPALCLYGQQTDEVSHRYNWNNPIKCIREPPHITQGNLFVVPKRFTRWLEMAMERSIERNHDLGIVRADETFILPILHDFRNRFHLHIKTDSDMNWIRARRPDVDVRDTVFRIIDRIPYVDENNNVVNHHWLERNEQHIARRFIPRDATVLELGARYGTVSCVINSILNDPKRHVAVDPDASILQALQKNRDSHGAQFHIFSGAVSRKPLFLQPESYCTHTTSQDTGVQTQSLTIEELEKVYGMSFDCLVADCEGFMEQFVRENEDFVRRLNMVTYEEDQGSWCDYNYVSEKLRMFGFVCVYTEANGTLNYRVWKKKNQGYFLLANGEKYIRMMLENTIPSIRSIDPYRPISVFTSTPELLSGIEGIDQVIRYDPEKEFRRLGIPLDTADEYDRWGTIPRFLELTRSPYEETLSLDCDLVCIPGKEARLEEFWDACTTSGQNMVVLGESDELNRGPASWHWGLLHEVCDKTGVNIPQIGGQCVYYRRCPDFLDKILPYFKNYETYGIKPWLRGCNSTPSEEIFFALYMGLNKWHPMSTSYIEHLDEYREPQNNTLFVHVHTKDEMVMKKLAPSRP
jgi:FkbM family methyltransferase